MPNLSQAGGQTRWLRVALPAALVIIVGGVVGAEVIHGLGAKREEAVLPAGSAFVASLRHTVSTEHAAVGDAVTLETVEPVVQNGQTVVPAGAEIRGEVTRANDGGRVAGAPELSLRFTELASDGETYRLDARPLSLRGTNDVGKSAAEIGGGAVAGGILGGVLGGGKGAVAGAVLGAAAGTGVAVATKGGHIVLPAGQKLQVRLEGPITVSYRPSAQH